MLSSLTIIFGVIGASFGLSPNSAGVQTMKPGLWEMNSTVGANPETDKAMAKMQEQMASMTPEQRKMMEDMMAKSGMSMGNAVGGAAGGAMVVRTCVSKEMAGRSQMPMQQQGDCSSTIGDQSSTGMKLKFSCVNPPSSGESQFSFSGDKAYKMKMKVNTTVAGKPQTTTIDGAGKWLAADCGGIKPMAMPKQQ
ncbi:MAG: DUF3617 domain-containing protein [Polaromonas sp.]|nr:DUF3617 domain-containing protein [Polaromonas sp.]